MRRPPSRRPQTQRQSPAPPPTDTSQTRARSWSPHTPRSALRHCSQMTHQTMPPLGSTSSSEHSPARRSRMKCNREQCSDSRSRPRQPSERSCRYGKELSLEASPAERAQLPLRQGRAVAWIEEALDPLRTELSKAAIHRLTLAIRSATGIESFVWLTDVAGLSPKDATDLMRWSASALLRTAIDGLLAASSQDAVDPLASRPTKAT